MLPRLQPCERPSGSRSPAVCTPTTQGSPLTRAMIGLPLRQRGKNCRLPAPERRREGERIAGAVGERIGRCELPVRPLRDATVEPGGQDVQPVDQARVAVLRQDRVAAPVHGPIEIWVALETDAVARLTPIVPDAREDRARVGEVGRPGEIRREPLVDRELLVLDDREVALRQVHRHRAHEAKDRVQPGRSERKSNVDDAGQSLRRWFLGGTQSMTPVPPAIRLQGQPTAMRASRGGSPTAQRRFSVTPGKRRPSSVMR